MNTELGRRYEMVVKSDCMRELEIALTMLRSLPDITRRSFDTTTPRADIVEATNDAYQKVIDSFLDKLCNCLAMRLEGVVESYISETMLRKRGIKS